MEPLVSIGNFMAAVKGGLISSLITYILAIRKYRLEVRESYLYNERAKVYKELFEGIIVFESVCRVITGAGGEGKQEIKDMVGDDWTIVSRFQRTLDSSEILIDETLFKELKKLDRALSISLSFSSEIASGKARHETTLENYYKIIDEARLEIPSLKKKVIARMKAYLAERTRQNNNKVVGQAPLFSEDIAV